MKKREILLMVVAVLMLASLTVGCNFDGSSGALFAAKASLEVEVLPEGADITVKTDKSLKEELDQGVPTAREIQLDKYHAKHGLLEKKESILARKQTQNQ